MSSASGITKRMALGVDAAGAVIDSGDLFPVGSASKLATGLLILRLVDLGTFELDAPLSEYLPAAAASSDANITIRRLLTHTSGLGLEAPHELSSPPGELRYNEALKWPGKLAETCLAEKPVQPAGHSVRYSNIGYGLLGLAAERQCNAPFKNLIRSHVLDPAGVEGAWGEVPSQRAIVIRDTPSPYIGTDIEPINSAHWLSIGSPWAGLLTNVDGLLKLVRAYLDESPIISTELARLARSNQTVGLSGGFPAGEAFLGHALSKEVFWKDCAWGLTVEIQGGKRPHWAPSSLPRSFGQIGSTGCLAWCDPDSGLAWAILGARSADTGWLTLYGPKIAQAAVAAFAPSMSPERNFSPN